MDHRHGVKYNNADVRQKFAKTDVQAGKQARQDFRGKDGQKVLDPNRDRPRGGDRERPGAGDRERPGAGDRDRPSAGDRDRGDRQGVSKGGGERPSGGGQEGGPAAGRAGGPEGGPAAEPTPQRDTIVLACPIGPSCPPATPIAAARASEGAAERRAAAGAAAARWRWRRRPRWRRGGRRSDVALKHDIVLLGHLDNGLGFYRFSYNDSDKTYVGVMAQEVEAVVPEAVVRGRDGYLRVFYDKLGLEFQSYDRWIASGARLPAAVRH